MPPNAHPGISEPQQLFAQAAQDRQAQLTKPAGALGRLEDLAIQLASLQGRERPAVDHIHMVIFAADHGVVAEGVSAFPQSVTVAMIRNFATGGAAMSVLAKQLNAHLQVVNLGTLNPHEALPGVQQLAIMPGTANFCEAPAMTEAQCQEARTAGRQVAEHAAAAGRELFIAGEMGIGNTTAAAALACALLNAAPTELVGPGTGLDAAGVAHKAAVIERALTRHGYHPDAPATALQTLGGLEIAALAEAYIAAAEHGLPVLIDGFISSVAALAASRLAPALRPWLLFAHTSAEPGHQRVLTALQAHPLLDLGMRLGEGSGAAIAVPLLQSACALHNQMATFAEAAVAGPNSA